MKASCLYKNFKNSSSLQFRWNSSKVKVKLRDEVMKSMEDNNIKPRNHPGIIKHKLIKLPDWVVEAMEQTLDDSDRPKLKKECKDLDNFLFSRRLPLEDYELKAKYDEIEIDFLKDHLKDLSPDEIEEKRKNIKGKVLFKLKQKVYGWKPLEYTNHKSRLYMLTRSAAEYSVLQTIFNEIQVRDPEFDPKTAFDYGAGVGSVLWALTERWTNINEYLAVDVSNEMNELSIKILSLRPKPFKGAFYRRYLPVTNLEHDITVSAYSLMELQDVEDRLQVIAKLWKKTSKYLVIIEQGTNAGFKLINEARTFIQHIMENVEKDTKYCTFAPCPHDLPCPRYGQNTPCNFITSYHTLPLLGNSKPKQELYSYVVFKKGERTANDNWYRLVRPTILRSKHTRCRMCTANGQLEEIVFTAFKYGKPLYRCAKVSDWGDRLPVLPNSESQSETTLEDTENKENKEKEFSSEDDAGKKDEQKEKMLSSEAPFSTIRNNT